MRRVDQQSELDALLAALFRGALTQAQAERLAGLGPDAVRLALLAANARIAQLQPQAPSPSTPSGMVPVHEKPGAGKRRRKKRGAKEGHAGRRRPTPDKIDARVEHRLAVCPCCSGPLQRCKRTRTRIIETSRRRSRRWSPSTRCTATNCPSCKKHVEPVVSDAMPNAMLGHNVVALSSWFHYGLGVTIGQTRDILASHLHTSITAAGLLDGWHRLAGALEPWYEQIAGEAKDGSQVQNRL